MKTKVLAIKNGSSGSLLQQPEREADLPVTHDLPIEQLPRPLLLLTADGLVLDGRPIERAAVAAEARNALAAGPQREFLNILAERSVPATRLLDLVGHVQAAGVEVRLVTLREMPRAAAARAGGADP
mgnify:CR=1 FL=1